MVAVLVSVVVVTVTVTVMTSVHTLTCQMALEYLSDPPAPAKDESEVSFVWIDRGIQF